ncbi:Eisosome assembly protein [Elasticomyces elasticus]|uniref:Eisosome assembly protein n=1 Tax=Exophiala sideris TaxID=1016849 RepID=A0ABR0J6P8_9EURO|nr:Eisosome assembly protein [Elasticomyces elasticus]KAK5027473.1 Eisosome assembly protein [Exophiala sideris]KAK5034823.1 Eisosome assembly protein [Exophiala sideris]KAK5056441.1 Eisosome assembly protein [Exophiala sideris]KAK5181069.1 Eisosome assembly protein [Eurotiomycetes sp. CCFEE 6388]
MSALSDPKEASFPSVEKHLEDQAASAALYRPRDTASKQSASSILDKDGRLSSASAATSLKYARAQDLPSYPSKGGVKLASAGAAASLADSNKKSVDLWTPGNIPAANIAADKAKDYEMDPLWEPELSKGASKAALIAHRDQGPVNIWRATESDTGSSAATSALQNQFSPPAITEREVSKDGRQKALLAATASMSSGRRRAESAPMKPQPPPGNSAWALQAANSISGRKSSDIPASQQSTNSGNLDPARIQNMARKNINRQMYTANPPVAIEVEERNRQDMLRASAVAMAKKMYAIQQTHIDDARGIRRSESHYAAHTARKRAQSDAANEAIPAELPRYENLEEAARKLAQERLAKLHDENAEYRQYYGQTSPQKQSRLSLRGRPRRTSNLQDDSDSDEEQSRRIKTQMSIFQSKLAEVDTKKRQSDRDALLAIAHKNVTARMNVIDEQVFSETGKTSPQQREQWERQARERAQRDSDQRMVNVGKVHIGGGKYLDQSEIDAIARARLQPTFDEISEKAEAQRARDEEIRKEQERIKAEQEAERQRQAKIKADQKAVADREKAEARAQKAEEKRKLEEQRHEERRIKTEQKAAEKKAREEALAASRGTEATPTKKGLLPGFLSRGAAGAGATAATATPAAEIAVEGTTGAVDTPVYPTMPPVEPGEIAGETVHDQVTSDKGEAPHIISTDNEAGVAGLHEEVTTEEREAPHVISADTEAGIAAKPLETTDAEAATEPAADTGVKDAVSSQPYSATQEPTSLTSPTSPASPSKRNSTLGSWFKKFRTGSKAETDTEKPALTRAEPTTTTAENTNAIEEEEEEDKPASDSIRDVALAGRKSDVETDDLYGGSAREEGRVSPVQEGHGETYDAVTDPARPISPVSESDADEEPFVMATDVASSKYESEHGDVSKRNSGMNQLDPGAVSDTDSEPRGRKGFRERFLKNIIPGRADKEKHKSTTEPAAAVASPIAEETTHKQTATDAKPHANPDATVLAETEPLREKIQESSKTSTEVPNTGSTTPALTRTQTDGDDDEDFEEARDTFDEQRLPATASMAKMESPRLVEVGKKSEDGSSVGGRNSIGSATGSRFTEEL